MKWFSSKQRRNEKSNGSSSAYATQADRDDKKTKVSFYSDQVRVEKSLQPNCKVSKHPNSLNSFRSNTLNDDTTDRSRETCAAGSSIDDNAKPGYSDFLAVSDPTPDARIWRIDSSNARCRQRKSSLDGVSLKKIPGDLRIEKLKNRAKLLQSYVFACSNEVDRLNAREKELIHLSAIRKKKFRLHMKNGLRNSLKLAPFLIPDYRLHERPVSSRALSLVSQSRIDSFLQSIPLFINLPKETIRMIYRRLNLISFEPNEVIVLQGSPSDAIFLIEFGSAVACVAEKCYEQISHSSTAYGRIIDALEPGDYFGDKGMFDPSLKYEFTVLATSYVTCLTISRETLLELHVDLSLLIHSSRLDKGLGKCAPDLVAIRGHVENYSKLVSLLPCAVSDLEVRLLNAYMVLLTAFAPENSIDDASKRMIEVLHRVFDCLYVALYEVHWKSSKPNTTLFYWTNRSSRLKSPIDSNAANKCALSGQIVNQVFDIGTECSVTELLEDSVSLNMLFCPLFDDRGSVVRVIEVVSNNAFSTEDERLMDALTSQISLALIEQTRRQALVSPCFSPSWKVETKLTIFVGEFVSSILSAEARSGKVAVGVSVYHATDRLCEEVRMNSKKVLFSPGMRAEFGCNIEMNIQLMNLPPASKIVFKLYFVRRESYSSGDIDSVYSIGDFSGGYFDKYWFQSRDSRSHDHRFGSFPYGARRSKLLKQQSKDSKDGRRSVLDRTLETRLENEKPVSYGSRMFGVIGWTSCPLFDFQQLMVSGSMQLKVSRESFSPKAAAAFPFTSAKNPEKMDSLVVEFPNFPKPVIYAYSNEFSAHVSTKEEITEDQAPVYGESQRLKTMSDAEAVINKDPLKELCVEEKKLIVDFRDRLLGNPASLPLFLRSINWNKRQGFRMAHEYLFRWGALDPLTALALLGPKFPDPKVRALAVHWLEYLSDEDLRFYLLQLTHVLRFERFLDNALSRFLLRRALRNPKVIGQKFFWLLKAAPSASNKHEVLLECFLRSLPRKQRQSLKDQMCILNQLREIRDNVVGLSKKKRDTVLKDRLCKLSLPKQFHLPINPEELYTGIRIESSMVMGSKKAPLKLEFTHKDSPEKNCLLLYKVGDDLRQDQLTLQMFSLMDSLWKKEGLDMCLECYTCVSTGQSSGIIEVVKNSETIATIVAGRGHTKVKKVARVLDDKRLMKWLSGGGYSRKVFEHNFRHSTAGYCVGTYVLGIGDRHNDNIMVTRDGRLFHIDFGHVLGNFKEKFGVKRDRVPFVFTPAMARVLGTQTSEVYQEFEDLCCRAFNTLRRHAKFFITAFSLMLYSGLPNLKNEKSLDWLRDKLLLEASEEEAETVFKRRIEESLNSVSTQINDMFHIARRG